MIACDWLGTRIAKGESTSRVIVEVLRCNQTVHRQIRGLRNLGRIADIQLVVEISTSGQELNICFWKPGFAFAPEADQLNHSRTAASETCQSPSKSDKA